MGDDYTLYISWFFCVQKEDTQYMKKIVAIILLVSFVFYVQSQWTPQESEELYIAMLDIGQGDAIYIRTPAGNDILVDGGIDRTVLSELGSVMPPYDHTLEMVVATHPDLDHIGGLAELPEAYDIEMLVISGAQKDTAAAEALEHWKDDGVQTVTAFRGWRLDVEDGVWLEFLHPVPGTFHEDPNDDSVMFVLHYGEFSALFTGDAPTEIEQELVEEGWLSSIDLLKVGHHGSKTSTSRELLEVTRPEIALISAGYGNKFGHPHAGPLLRFQEFGVQVFRTDEQGRIECRVTRAADVQCQ